MDPETDDIAGDIRAALEQTRANMPEQPAVPEVVEAAPVVETPEPEAKSDGRERDEFGRFKPKEAEAAAQTEAKPGPKIPAPQQSAEASEDKPLTPPRHWEPEAKAQFMAAPPAVQKQLLAHAEAIAKGEEEWKPRAQTWEQVEQAIGPVKDSWAMRGISIPQGVQMLATAQRMLDENPVQALAQIAKSYGFTPETLLQAWGMDLSGMQAPGYEQQGVMPPQFTNYIQSLESKVNALSSVYEQQQEAVRMQAQASLQKEIDDFAADPNHVYFENVKPRMVALLQTQQATDLATAYEMATWADPQIRKLIMAKEVNDRQQAEAKRVQQARRAGVSVTGDPGPGRAGSALPDPSSTSARDDIAADVRRAMRDVRAQA